MSDEMKRHIDHARDYIMAGMEPNSEAEEACQRLLLCVEQIAWELDTIRHGVKRAGKALSAESVVDEQIRKARAT